MFKDKIFILTKNDYTDFFHIRNREKLRKIDVFK